MNESEYSSASRRPVPGDPWLSSLAHDLRQPLGTIQNSVCYLKLILANDARAMAQLDMIELQVGEADMVLSKAVGSVRGNSIQRADAGDGNFDFTKDATAGVT